LEEGISEQKCNFFKAQIQNKLTKFAGTKFAGTEFPQILMKTIQDLDLYCEKLVYLTNRKYPSIKVRVRNHLILINTQNIYYFSYHVETTK
jgi:hypothetical protein